MMCLYTHWHKSHPHPPNTPTPPHAWTYATPSKAVYAAPVTKTQIPILTATATISRPNDDAAEWRRPSGP